MSEPVFDPAPLRAWLGDDAALLEELLAQFAGELDALLDQLRAAATRGDAARVHALAHRLKSSSRSIGAGALADACEQLELRTRRLDRLADADACSWLDPLLLQADTLARALQRRAAGG